MLLEILQNFQSIVLQNTSGRLVLICNFRRSCFSIEGSCSWLALMAAIIQIVMTKVVKYNVLINKQQVLHEFFDKDLKYVLKYVLRHSVKRNNQNNQKINHSDCYKKWLLWSVRDIY